MSTIYDMPSSNGSGGVYTIQCDMSPVLRYCPQQLKDELSFADYLDQTIKEKDPGLRNHDIQGVEGGIRYYAVVASHFYPINLYGSVTV